MVLQETIKAVQTALRKKGLYHGPIDGIAGNGTWAGIHEAIIGPAVVVEPRPGEAVPSVDRSVVDERSEKAIATLHPKVKPIARALVNEMMRRGVKIVVTSGTRTYEEQNELYAQGRTKPGKVVTNARGGYSWHNFGIAFDITIFNGSQPVWESPKYKDVGEAGKKLGLEWGGDWRFKDEPHFQYNPKGLSLADARIIKSTGGDLI